MNPIEALADTFRASLSADQETEKFTLRIESIRPILSPMHFDALCENLGICTKHICDIEICIDDDADCMIDP